MLILALLMAVEKNVRWGRRLSAPVGAALLAVGRYFAGFPLTGSGNSSPDNTLIAAGVHTDGPEFTAAPPKALFPLKAAPVQSAHTNRRF